MARKPIEVEGLTYGGEPDPIELSEPRDLDMEAISAADAKLGLLRRRKLAAQALVAPPPPPPSPKPRPKPKARVIDPKFVHLQGQLSKGRKRDPRDELGDYFLPTQLENMPHTVEDSYIDPKTGKVWLRNADMPRDFRDYHLDMLKTTPSDGIQIDNMNQLSPGARDLLFKILLEKQRRIESVDPNDPSVAPKLK